MLSKVVVCLLLVVRGTKREFDGTYLIARSHWMRQGWGWWPSLVLCLGGHPWSVLVLEFDGDMLLLLLLARSCG